MRHCEKRRNWVCSLVMEVVSIEMLSFTLETQEEKKVVAKEADPTGWPMSRKPVVSSTGRGGADLSVGCGRVENSAIVEEIDVARAGLVVWRRGNVEEPLHEVSIRHRQARPARAQRGSALVRIWRESEQHRADEVTVRR